MTNIDESLALFDDSSPEGSSKLDIAHATFAGNSRSSFEELISGYSSMRVLTYSDSISMIFRVAKLLDEIEIVFGREDIISGETGEYFLFQQELVKELRSETRGKDIVEQKISSGKIRLHVVKDEISHEKLFLLEGERGTRVVTGSANFSNRALSGKQNEGITRFDDEGAWKYYGEKYEKIRAKSTMEIGKRAILSDRFDPEDLPVLSADGDDGSGGVPVVMLEENRPTLSVVRKMVSPRLPKQYRGMNQVIPTKKGAAQIDRQVRSNAVRYIKSNSRTKEDNPEEYLSIGPGYERAILSGKVLDLGPTKAEVRRDTELLLEYFGGYERFRGDTERLARGYFTFMSWLYVSPFICDFRNAALRRGEHVWNHPVFGILYGHSNCGKSELVSTLLVSMFQRGSFLQNDWFTRTGVLSIREQNKRYPLAFDDLSKKRYGDYAVPLIKEDFIASDEYPVTVLSMNAEQDSFETEVRKRALIVYTNASLPDDTSEMGELGSRVASIKRDLGNAVYREYLKRAMADMRESPPRDALRFSSEILMGIFAEHRTEELPTWCRPTSMEEYRRGKHDKIKDELSQRMRHSPDAWRKEGGKVVYRLDDVHDLRKLKKDVPDYLTRSGSGGNALVFDAEELREFLGELPFEKNGASRLFRLFKGRK